MKKRPEQHVALQAPISRHLWNRRWVQPETCAALREQYNNDLEAYKAEYHRLWHKLSQQEEDRRARSRAIGSQWLDKGVRKLSAFFDAFLDKPVTTAEEIDFILVGIDFEGRLDIGKPTDIGIAMLDTRDLLSTQLPDSLEALITSKSFAVGRHAQVSRVARNFLFGETVMISSTEVGATIAEALRVVDTHDDRGELRKIILVAHGIHAEVSCLKHMGLKFEDIAPVVGRLDTQKLGPGTGLPLYDLVEGLAIPMRRRTVHKGGNDAHLTMRALLNLACREREGQDLRPDSRSRLEVLLAFMRSPPPDPTERNRERTERNGTGDPSIDWVSKFDGGVFEGISANKPPCGVL